MNQLLLNAETNSDTLVELLQQGARIPLTVTGTSMLPLLKPDRDAVLLVRISPEQLRRGRIVLFHRSDGRFVLHRIRRVLPDGSFLINGDAQAWCETIPADSITAAVEAIIRDGKFIPRKHPLLRLWDILWAFTRPFRPYIFRLYACRKRLLSCKEKNV